MDVKEYYSKKGLPDFAMVASEFDLSSIEGENFARKIAEKLIEKIEKYRHLLEEFLHADGNSFSVLMEMREMTEVEKEEVSALYQELVVIERSFLAADLDAKEEALLEFIKRTLLQWNALKPRLKVFALKIRDSWKNLKKGQEELGYLG